MSNKIRNKIRVLNEDIKSLNQAIERAKVANKKHFIKRLKMIIEDKHKKIRNLISQSDQY